MAATYLDHGLLPGVVQNVVTVVLLFTLLSADLFNLTV